MKCASLFVKFDFEMFHQFCCFLFIKEVEALQYIGVLMYLFFHHRQLVFSDDLAYFVISLLGTTIALLYILLCVVYYTYITSQITFFNQTNKQQMRIKSFCFVN